MVITIKMMLTKVIITEVGIINYNKYFSNASYGGYYRSYVNHGDYYR